jgi:hypothetical protein
MKINYNIADLTDNSGRRGIEQLDTIISELFAID